MFAICIYMIDFFYISRFNKFVPDSMLTRDVPHDGNCFFSAASVHFSNAANLGMLVKIKFCVDAVFLLETLIDKVCT